ncbi:amino acid transporter [Purpureocillium lavendulum]|uniref:Amino acid transporter n=1 Tax=Purpureocillium lavendulum TaxID=1247861 RepID=A0AB34FFR6_9HYPO|nr:amino acid transporter [Purpureocillium lavendulum]
MRFKKDKGARAEQHHTTPSEKDHSSIDDGSLQRHGPRGGVLVADDGAAPPANIFSEGGTGKTYRTLTRWDTILVLVTNQVGLGILSLPKILLTLGLVPGIIAILGLGVVSTYTAYELLQFWRAHPHCVNMVDMARVVGGRPLEAILGVSLLIKICMTCGSATVTIAVALNSISGHALCTVGFAGVGAIACWLLCLPRTFKFVSQTGVPSTVSIFAAVLIVIISLGVAGSPTNAPPGWDKEIVIVGNPSFRDGVSACLKVCYAYAGNVGFVSYMAEMKDPSRDFVPALGVLQVFSVILYLVTAVAIYCLSGQYTTSPALGSAPLLPAKVAYGVVLPALLSTGLVFGHTAIKYLYVVAMRAMKRTQQMTDNSARSWTTWVLCATAFWAVSFVLANAIPIFDSILSIASATFIAWFTFGISGVFWYHRNWQEKFERRNLFLAVVNALLILQSLFMNGVGLWAAVQGLIDIFNDKENKIGGAFTCADNSIF